MTLGDLALFIFAGAVIAFASCMRGWAIGEEQRDKYWRKLLVERDLAEYDPKTAGWKWKEPAP